MQAILFVARVADRVNEAVGRAVAWLSLTIVLVQFTVEVMRCVFGGGSLYMQESIIYMHEIMVLMVAGYTLKPNGHVRIDIFYGPASPRKRAWIDLAGVFVFLLPACGFVLYSGWPYVAASWASLEGSIEGRGLPAVFLLKTTIMVFPVLLAQQGLALASKSGPASGSPISAAPSLPGAFWSVWAGHGRGNLGGGHAADRHRSELGQVQSMAIGRQDGVRFAGSNALCGLKLGLDAPDVLNWLSAVI